MKRMERWEVSEGGLRGFLEIIAVNSDTCIATRYKFLNNQSHIYTNGLTFLDYVQLPLPATLIFL